VIDSELYRLKAPGPLSSNDVVESARWLLGKYLKTEIEGKVTIGKIVETEAYSAPEDKASHAFGNKRTKRTETMFGFPGTSYVYLCYGIVLIRAVEPISGIAIMQERRGKKFLFDKIKPQLTAGPGVLTKALAITRTHNGLNIFSPQSQIQLFASKQAPSFEIIASPRVGIDYAEEWIDKPWRFTIKGNAFCSAKQKISK